MWIGCGLALLHAGCASVGTASDRERAQRQYELAVGLQAEGNDVGAFKTLYEALELDPDNAQAHQLLGTLYLLSRDDDPVEHDRRAEQAFRRVLALEAETDKPVKKLVADAYNGLGVLKIHQGDAGAAVAFLRKAVEADPFNADAYMAWGNLGWAHQELGQTGPAVKALQRAVKLNPGFCVGHFRLGTSLMSAKAYDEAEQSLTRAIEAHESCKTFQDAWQWRGTARMSLGHRDDARFDFERCVELAPTSEAGASCQRYLEATY